MTAACARTSTGTTLTSTTMPWTTTAMARMRPGSIAARKQQRRRRHRPYVAWQASLVAYKVCDRSGSCATGAIAKAIRQAAHVDADIINMSLGGGCAQTIADAVNCAYFDHGMTIVAAAGNKLRASLSRVPHP